MKRGLRKTLVAAAVGATMVGISSTASAFVYGLSTLEVQNFLFVSDPTEVTVTSLQFSLTNSATLGNAAPTTTSATCFGSPAANNCGVSPAPVLDPVAAQQGTPTGENNFTPVGTGVQYARADSIITTAQLIDGVPSSLNMIAENNLLTASSAQDSVVLQSTTNLIFDAAAGASFTLDFEADLDMRVAIAEALAGIYNTQSNVVASFSLTRTDGTGSITWIMNGDLNAADCVVSGAGLAGATCVETADGGGALEDSLNRQLSSGTNPSDLTYGVGEGFNPYGISVAGLPEGEYSLALNASVSGTKFRIVQVPEPASIGLLGLGLLGMGLAFRRSANKA